MTQSKNQSSAPAVGEAWCLVWTHTSGRPASRPAPRPAAWTHPGIGTGGVTSPQRKAGSRLQE